MKKILFIGDSRMIHFKRMINYFYDNFNFHVVVLISIPNKKIRAHSVIIDQCISKSKKKWIFNNYKLRALVKRHKISIVNVHYIPSGFTSFLIPVPLVITAYGGDVSEVPNNFFSLQKILTKVLLKKSQKVFIDSYDLKNNLERYFKIESEKIKYFQWGVDLNKVKNIDRSLDYRDKFNIPKNKKVIISYRGWTERYNILTLLDAYSELIKSRNDIVLVIKNTALVYDSKYQEKVKSRLLKKDLLNSTILIQNNLPYTDLLELLSVSDIYVSVPSQDATAMSLLESLSLGAIPLLSNIESSKEWIEDKVNGFLCEVNVESIKKTLDVLLDIEKNEINQIKDYNHKLIKKRGDQTKCMNDIYQNYIKINNDSYD